MWLVIIPRLRNAYFLYPARIKNNNCRYACPYPCTLTGDTDQKWLQDLDDILQVFLQSCSKSPLRTLVLNLPHPQNSSSRPLLSNESVGGLKTVMLALALWQRALRVNDITQPTIEREVQREKVKPLQR